MKFDAEDILVEIQTYLQANLNTKIAEINSEKNDSITLNSVSTDAYFLQTLNDSIANFDPYILIGLDDMPSVGIGPATLKTLTFTVVLVLADTQDLLIGRRMLRYGRALEEIFNEGFQRILPFVSFKVNSLVPIAITSVNSNDPYRAVGVEVVTALG